MGGLFGRDEMDEICGALAMPLKKFNKAIEPNQENLLDFYKVRLRHYSIKAGLDPLIGKIGKCLGPRALGGPARPF